MKAIVFFLNAFAVLINEFASASESFMVFIKAPLPIFTSRTKPSIPSANFLLIMLAVISGIDSTVPVTSRRE